MAEQRIALITGANKGIGYETARQLGEAGVTVLVGARSSSRGEEAAAALAEAGADARSVVLDVTDSDAIAKAAAWVGDTFGRLDILVNNAGIGLADEGPPGSVPLDVVRATFETNVIGALAVTQAMLALLKTSDAGRIVNVSSMIGSLGLQTDPSFAYGDHVATGYGASKAALNYLTVGLSKELAGTPVKVNSVNPGFTATDFNNHAGVRSVREGAAASVRYALIGADGPSGGFFGDEGVVPW